MATQTASLLWVCTDCLYAQEGLEGDDTAPDREPLGLIPETAEVTTGMLWEEHESECPNRAAEEWREECECERVTFTWRACEGCGSGLGGERHALTLWS